MQDTGEVQNFHFTQVFRLAYERSTVVVNILVRDGPKSIIL